MAITSPFVVVLTADEQAVLFARTRSGRTEHQKTLGTARQWSEALRKAAWQAGNQFD